MVRDAGATEVHFRIASPPTTHSCFYGVDTPNKQDLLAHKLDLAGMREFIKADSLAFDPAGGRLACFMLDGKCAITSDAGRTWHTHATGTSRRWARGSTGGCRSTRPCCSR